MRPNTFGTRTPALLVLGGVTLLLGLTGAVRFTEERSIRAGACSLITRPEAAAALGRAVPAGAEKVMDLPLLGRTVKAQMCFYGTEVSLIRYELGGQAPDLFAQYRKSLIDRDDYESVSGVGDEAFFAKGQLAVRKGPTGFIVDVGQARGGGAPEMKAERGLAVRVVGRL
jgi:hypothetical protein